MKRVKVSARAFTLIELLVVVAIIALLISILLPSLSRAREQARIGVCQSNLRSIATASVNYYMDNDDLVFTWPRGYWDDRANVGMFGGLWTEFIWGGDVPDAELNDWDPSQGEGIIELAIMDNVRADILKFPAGRRPLNWYLDPDMSWDNPKRTWRPGSTDPPERTELKSLAPGYFRCPSDKTCAVPDVDEPDKPYDPDTPYTTWKNWGTSYPINWYWAYFYTKAYSKPRKFVNYLAGGLAGKGKGGQLLKSKQASGASEFVLFYENHMNFAMKHSSLRKANGEPVAPGTYQYIGWHGQKDYHTAAFFDGHAEYRRFDTRFHDGPGWTTWPNRDEWEKFDVFDEYINY